MTRLPFL
nr:unnamed protein product [Callosobruchus chinensis]